jgi:ribosomal-protein-alanine N-acetyltransferase
MFIRTTRLLLRDFVPSDREAFVAYQIDPRHRRLYDIDDGEDQRAHDLFDLFVSWQQETPRQNFQVGIFERDSDRLCGCAGLRKAGASAGTAVLGIELTPDDWGRYRLAVEVVTALID